MAMGQVAVKVFGHEDSWSLRGRSVEAPLLSEEVSSDGSHLPDEPLPARRKESRYPGLKSMGDHSN